MNTPPTGAFADDDTVVGSRRLVSVMGTVFTLDLRDLDPASHDVDAVVAWWRWVDRTFSTYRPDSQISRLGEGALRLEDCAPEVRYVLGLCERAAETSGGFFTDRPNGTLDPSGMVKGWSVEVASLMMRRAGSHHHCITAGGDVRAAGAPEPGGTWRIGIVDPFDTGRLLAFVEASDPTRPDLAVATSGTSERGNHIVDPLAGGPARGLASVTVVGEDLTLVDWTATAAFAMGNSARTWLENTPDIEALAVTARGQMWATSGFSDVGMILAQPTAGTAVTEARVTEQQSPTQSGKWQPDPPTVAT